MRGIHHHGQVRLALEDGHRVQVVQLQAPFAPGGHQVRLLEHAKVLHDPKAGHGRQALGKLGERLAITLEEPVQELAPVEVRQGPEHGFHAQENM